MSRLIIRIDVVFPQPEGPTSVVIFPLGAVSVSPSTATVPSGYTLETVSNVIMTVLLVGQVWRIGSAGRTPPRRLTPICGRTVPCPAQ